MKLQALIVLAVCVVFFTSLLVAVQAINVDLGLGWKIYYNETANQIVLEDAEFLLVGNATAWDDLQVPIGATTIGGSRPPTWQKITDDGSGSQGVWTYYFDNVLEQELYFSVQLPHSWKEGGIIEPHIHWTPSTIGSGNVTWAMEYTWASIGSTYPPTSFLYVTAPTGGVINKHQYASFGNINGSGKTHSSMIMGRLFRATGNATDTYGGDAGLLTIDFHIEVEKFGEFEKPNGMI